MVYLCNWGIFSLAFCRHPNNPPSLCYLLISRVANYDHNHRFLTVFIELIIIEELHAMNMLEVKFLADKFRIFRIFQQHTL